MEVLSEAMNTYNPALEVLLSRGYCLFGEFESDDGPLRAWIAERSDVRLAATTPLGLLGLAMLWEQQGPAWRTRTKLGPNDRSILYDRLLDGERIFPTSSDQT